MREAAKLGLDCFMPEARRVEVGDGRSFWDYRFTTRPLHPDADVYLFQRRMERIAPGLYGWLRKQGKVVTCDIDDLYPLPAYNAASRGSDPRHNPYRNYVFLHAGYRQVDALTVSTPFLAERYAGYCDDITVFPNRLDWEMWENVVPEYESGRERVLVGWLGLASFRERDLDVLRGTIPTLLRRNPHVDFAGIADNFDDDYCSTFDVLRVPEGRRVLLPRAKFRDLRSAIRYDVGLVPLVANDFNEAKSALKGMEYNACGVPFVASPSSSYREWTDEGENGFLARRGHDWLHHLELLVNDHELRHEMGRKGRVKAEAHSIQRHAGRWVDYYARFNVGAAA